MKTILLDPTQTLVVAIIGYFVGRLLTEKIGFLDKFRIPEAVTGGIVIAIGVTVLRGWGSVTISFTPSDVAMLTFFTTIGLSARISDLKAGGRTLVLTLLVCVLAVVAENLVGLGFAKLTGATPAMGIMAGSVALIGGHGTAATWAPLFESGSEAAGAVGLASATFGLVTGGVVGSPLGRQLIMRHKLKPADIAAPDLTLSNDEQRKGRIDVPQFFRSVLAIAIAIGIGEEINVLLNQVGFKLPHFVTSLFAGILIANIGPVALPRINWPTHSPAMRLIAELSLSIFLVRALMSLDCGTLRRSRPTSDGLAHPGCGCTGSRLFPAFQDPEPDLLCRNHFLGLRRVEPGIHPYGSGQHGFIEQQIQTVSHRFSGNSSGRRLFYRSYQCLCYFNAL